MKMSQYRSTLSKLWLLIFILLGMTTWAHAKINPVEIAKKSAESQLRHILEPVLDKYCRDECKLMSVNVTVDLATPDDIAPGFDEIQGSKGTDLAPSGARAKI